MTDKDDIDKIIEGLELGKRPKQPSIGPDFQSGLGPRTPTNRQDSRPTASPLVSHPYHSSPGSGLDELLSELEGSSPRPDSSLQSNGMTGMINEIYREIQSKSRTRRADPAELLIRTPRLYLLEGDETRRYAAAVQAITGALPIGDKFNIDALGHDPSIQGISQHYIIVSLKQFEYDILDGDYSFKRNLLAMLKKEASAFIDQVSFGEALFGRPKTGFSDLNFQDILLNLGECKEGLFRLELSLDTATGAIRTLKELQEAYKNLEKDPDLILKPGYRAGLIERARPLRQIHGPLDRIFVPDVLPIKTAEDFIKLSRDGQDLYCFRDKKTFLFIYFDDSGKISAPFTDKNCSIINGYDTDRLINTLFDAGLVSYSFTRGKEKLDALKKGHASPDDTLLDQVRKVETQNAVLPQDVQEFYSILEELKAGKNRLAYFKSLQVDTKLDLFVPLRADGVFYEMLSRSTQSRLMRDYTAGQPFVHAWNKASSGKRQEMIRGLLSQLQYEDEYNYSLNEWLSGEYAKECEAAGARFKLVQ